MWQQSRGAAGGEASEAFCGWGFWVPCSEGCWDWDSVTRTLELLPGSGRKPPVNKQAHKDTRMDGVLQYVDATLYVTSCGCAGRACKFETCFIPAPWNPQKLVDAQKSHRPMPSSLPANSYQAGGSKGRRQSGRPVAEICWAFGIF